MRGQTQNCFFVCAKTESIGARGVPFREVYSLPKVFFLGNSFKRFLIQEASRFFLGLGGAKKRALIVDLTS